MEPPLKKARAKKSAKTPTKTKKKTAAACWMVKQEPETYSWDDFVGDGHTDWTGVRNYQARNNLREMKTGERVLFYHSGKEKAVVGVAEVVKSAYPDPTADDAQWVAVDLKPIKPLKNPVPLAALRTRFFIRSEEHTVVHQSHRYISYAVLCF